MGFYQFRCLYENFVAVYLCFWYFHTLKVGITKILLDKNPQIPFFGLISSLFLKFHSWWNKCENELAFIYLKWKIFFVFFFIITVKKGRCGVLHCRLIARRSRVWIWLKSFCVEFASSLSTCMRYLQLLWLLTAIQRHTNPVNWWL